MGQIIDSSVLIAAERRKLDLYGYLANFEEESFFISAVTVSELWHGCHRAAGSVLKQRLQFIEQIESALPVVAFATEEAYVHARIWAYLEKTGQNIGSHDMIIAATALSCGHSLATLNEKEFKRVPKLKLEPSVRKFLTG